MEKGRNGRYEEGKRGNPAEELYDGWVAFVNRIFRAMTAKERFLALVTLALTGVIAYLAAEKGIPFLPESAGGGLSKPLGDAILCASGGCAPAAYLALVYAARQSGVGAVPRILALTALFVIRTGLGIRSHNGEGLFRGFYRENATVKVGSAALFSLLTVGIRTVSYPITAESLPELLAMLLFTPALTAILCGAFSDKDAVYAVNHRKLTEIYNELSTYALFAVCVYAAKGEAFAGSSLASLVAIFLTVVTAVRGGALRGGAVGAVLGLVISVSHAPILAVTGIFAGTLSGFGIGASVGISCAAGCVLAIYAYGYRAILTYVPEAIIATAVTSPVLKYRFLPEDFPFRGKRVRHRRGVTVLDGDVSRVAACSEAIIRVSDAFERLSADSCGDKKTDETVGIPDSELVCEQLRRGFCDTCPLVCICWDSGNKTVKGAVKRYVYDIYTPGIGVGDRLELETQEQFKCICPTRIRQEIIRICETPEVKGALLPPPPMGFSQDCHCISEILRDIAIYAEGDTSLDAASTAAARRAVSSLGISAEELAVFGERRRTAVLYGADESALNEKSERLLKALSRACGQRLSEPIRITDGAGTKGGTSSTRLVFKGELRYSVELACAEKKATGETENGDHSTSLITGSGWFYAILSDGMGSGVEAADCSENAVKTLKTLLESGVSPKLAAKLTGNSVKERRDECFATLDMLAFDCMTGEACVYKSGAACSFLLRNGEVRFLSAPSLPLGISYETEPEELTLSLSDGDVLVMISDGVAEDEADEIRLSERLSVIRETEPQRIADRLLSEAVAYYMKTDPHAKRDDMTVVAVKVRGEER